jgi:hypothetical protein
MKNHKFYYYNKEERESKEIFNNNKVNFYNISKMLFNNKLMSAHSNNFNNLILKN